MKRFCKKIFMLLDVEQVLLITFLGWKKATFFTKFYLELELQSAIKFSIVQKSIDLQSIRLLALNINIIITMLRIKLSEGFACIESYLFSIKAYTFSNYLQH